MSLSLSQVIEKAGKEEMAYVRDGPIHYIVLTRKDNTFNLDRVNRYLAILDEIEASEGPGLLVTMGTGNKIFSSGFDLPYWMKSFDNFKSSTSRF